MLSLTVAIPTYNGEKRLPKVLEALQCCSVHASMDALYQQGFSWEVIVVDNNSTDQTAKVVQHYQQNWAKPGQLRYCFEPRQGAAFARQQAIEQALSPLVGFIDDDNLPFPNWIAEAVKFAEANPQVGAYGGQIHGKFDRPPPQGFEKIACFLAIMERGEQAFRYEPERKLLPPGAGLVVRRQAWLTSVPQKLALNYRGREAGLASEDLEALLYLQQAGWEIWYNPRMEMDHEIPGWRLEPEYLRSVVRCIGLSRHHIRMLRFQPWKRPFACCACFLYDLGRLLLHELRFVATPESVVITCERQLLWCTLISPFFLWKLKYLQRQ